MSKRQYICINRIHLGTKDRAVLDSKKYVGPICKWLHKHNNTDQSVRYIKDGRCVECSRIKFAGQDKDSRRIYNLSYYNEHRNTLSKYHAAWGRRYSKELRDSYIRRLILDSTGLSISSITKEMISVKRKQMVIFRGLKKIRSRVAYV